MRQVATIGLDIAKDVFQVYGADEVGEPLFNRKLRRAEMTSFFEKLSPCTVGIEACSGAHHWARTISGYGHDVRLMHAAYVKPFVKRGKTDANDAEAIYEAVTRKTMRFVAIKTIDQQSAAMTLRTRSLLVRQKTQATNALRSHLSELGIVAGLGKTNLLALTRLIRKDEAGLPKPALFALEHLLDEIEFISLKVDHLDREISMQAKQDETARRLMTVPGVGPMTAVAVTSLLIEPAMFETARDFAAWIGLTPRASSSGGKQSLGSISKMGNSQLRSLLVMGAMSVLRVMKPDDGKQSWLSRLRSRRPFKVVAVALANKTARVIWALLMNGGTYMQSTD